jgi:hypothetical protein
MLYGVSGQMFKPDAGMWHLPITETTSVRRNSKSAGQFMAEARTCRFCSQLDGEHRYWCATHDDRPPVAGSVTEDSTGKGWIKATYSNEIAFELLGKLTGFSLTDDDRTFLWNTAAARHKGRQLRGSAGTYYHDSAGASSGRRSFTTVFFSETEIPTRIQIHGIGNHANEDGRRGKATDSHPKNTYTVQWSEGHTTRFRLGAAKDIRSSAGKNADGESKE